MPSMKDNKKNVIHCVFDIKPPLTKRNWIQMGKDKDKYTAYVLSYNKKQKQINLKRLEKAILNSDNNEVK